MLYSFNAPFQLLHADVANLEFLGKSVSVLNYALLIVDLYSSRVYVDPMHSRKQILKKHEQYHVDVQNRRKNKNMRLQVDNEFQQVMIKDLNDRYNIQCLLLALEGEKHLLQNRKSGN